MSKTAFTPLIKKITFIFFISLTSNITTAESQSVSQEELLSEAERRLVVEQISEEIVNNYVFPKIGNESADFIRQQFKSGKYTQISGPKEFAKKLTQDLQSISQDKHMIVRVGGRQMIRHTGDDPPLARVKRERQAQEYNYGLGKIEHLPNNIGYLNLNSFMFGDAKGEKKATAAMTYLSDSDAIILDVRENRGGNGLLANFIASYFLPKKTQLNSIYWRQGDRMMQAWSVDDLPGKRMLDVPLYLLTSDHTFSAAESFSYNLKVRERATIVGETTGGGANPGGLIAINERFSVFVSTGKAINPVTNSNWEGVGVEPDVYVSADKALDKAYEMAKITAKQFKQKAIENKTDYYRAFEKEISSAEALLNVNQKKAQKQVNKVLKEALDQYYVDELSINNMGYSYLRKNNPEMAIIIMTFNTMSFPGSSNAYDSLAEAYLAFGDKALAEENYAISRRLNTQQE